MENSEPTSNAELMSRARASLKGKWGLAIATHVVGTFLSLGLQSISKSGFVISCLIAGPLSLGFALFGLSLSRHEDAKLTQIFQGFKRFGVAFGAYVLIALIVFLWALFGIIIFIAAAIVVGLFYFDLSSFSMMTHEFEGYGFQEYIALLGDGSQGLMIISLGLIGFLLLLTPSMMVALGYSQTFFVIAENSRIDSLEALQASKTMMKGHLWRYAYLVSRFIGWMILGVLSLGIGFLWILPYMNISYAHFYDDLKNIQTT